MNQIIETSYNTTIQNHDEVNKFGVLTDNTLFSQNAPKQNISAQNIKQNEQILSFPQSSKMKCQSSSHNKENSSSYIKEGSIQLHFNSKREMILQPFISNTATHTNKCGEFNNTLMDSNKKNSEQNQKLNESISKYQQRILKTSDKNELQCESTISIELSAEWTPPQSSHSNSYKFEMQEESSQQMTSSGIVRHELQEVARNLNLMDLAQGADESPTYFDHIINNKFDKTKDNTPSDSLILDKDISTTSEKFLKEISSNILNTNKSSFNDFVSFEKKQKLNKKSNYDRFIPSRVETDTYKFFLASEDQYTPKQNSLDQFGNLIETNSSDSTASSSQSSIANSNNNMREEQNRQLYHNLLQAHFLENNTNTVTTSSAFSGDDSSIFSSQYSDNVSNNLKQKSYRPLKKLFSYGEGSSQQNSSFASQQCPSSSQLISNIPSSSNKKRNMYGSLINLPDYNNFNHEETPKLKINPRPYKILEAPTLKNDFYLNLLDWSPSNLVSVGLENYVYVLSGANQSVKTQFNIPEYIDPTVNQMYNDNQDNVHLSDYYNMVCSVGWSQRSDHIAVGDRQGKVYLFDLAKNQFLRVMHNHKGRVGQVSWNGNLIASGSRDRNIIITDVRDKNPHSMIFKGHEQEICGMRWSFDQQTLASGGNDNKVFLWSLKMNGKLAKISSSKAAVKAIGFSPHQHNILAFGGGTADRCIRMYDTQQLKQIDCIDTGSQVCNLIFSKNSKQIISTHGYSLNQIIVWNQSNMKKIATLTGHSQRVLYLAESPCGQNILTGAADETIRFWNIFRKDIVNELSPSSFGLR